MTLLDFPTFQRARATAPFLIGLLWVLLILLFPLLQPELSNAFAATLLAAMVLRSLLGHGYTVLHAVGITLLGLAHAGLFLSATGKGGSIWLALASFCVARTATEFVRHGDARRVMALGAALSFIQWVDPLGGLLALFLLPFCVGRPRAGQGRDKAGLFALLLFMPMVTAVLIAYLRFALGIEVGLHATGAIAPMPLPYLLVVCCASAPVLWLSVLVGRLKQPASLIVVYTALAIVLACLLSRTLEDGTSLLAACGAISIAALCSWKPSPQNQTLALAATALGTLLSWQLLNLSSVVR